MIDGGGIRRGTFWPARAVTSLRSGKPGDICPKSGVYRASANSGYEVALEKGEPFLSFSPRLDFLFSS